MSATSHKVVALKSKLPWLKKRSALEIKKEVKDQKTSQPKIAEQKRRPLPSVTASKKRQLVPELKKPKRTTRQQCPPQQPLAISLCCTVPCECNYQTLSQGAFAAPNRTLLVGQLLAQAGGSIDLGNTPSPCFSVTWNTVASIQSFLAGAGTPRFLRDTAQAQNLPIVNPVSSAAIGGTLATQLLALILNTLNNGGSTVEGCSFGDLCINFVCPPWDRFNGITVNRFIELVVQNYVQARPAVPAGCSCVGLTAAETAVCSATAAELTQVLESLNFSFHENDIPRNNLCNCLRLFTCCLPFTGDCPLGQVLVTVSLCEGCPEDCEFMFPSNTLATVTVGDRVIDVGDVSDLSQFSFCLTTAELQLALIVTVADLCCSQTVTLPPLCADTVPLEFTFTRWALCCNPLGTSTSVEIISNASEGSDVSLTIGNVTAIGVAPAPGTPLVFSNLPSDVFITTPETCGLGFTLTLTSASSASPCCSSTNTQTFQCCEVLPLLVCCDALV